MAVSGGKDLGTEKRPKRSNGEGTKIEERPGGYRARITVNGQRKSVSGKTKAEVRRKIAELTHNAHRGILPPAERLTVSEWMERWLEEVIKPSLRRKSVASYEQNYRCYIAPALGRTKLAQLTPAHLRRLYAGMQSGELSVKGQPLAAHSVRRCHAVLHAALEQAVADNLVPRNVAGNLKGLPAARSKREGRVLDAAQMDALLEAAGTGRYRALLTLALYTGLRQGELLGLRWEDVDLERKTLRVSQSLGPGKQVGAPKSAAGVRSMSLPDPAVESLREHRTAQDVARERACTAWTDTGLVFTTHKAGKAGKSGRYTAPPGSPLTQTVVDKALKAVLAKAGLPDIRFHELRHTACSYMARRGIHPTTAMKRMGHSDIRLTLQHYTHVLEEEDREAAAKLSRRSG